MVFEYEGFKIQIVKAIAVHKYFDCTWYKITSLCDNTLCEEFMGYDVKPIDEWIDEIKHKIETVLKGMIYDTV
jgi:hypothetical protein